MHVVQAKDIPRLMIMVISEVVVDVLVYLVSHARMSLLLSGCLRRGVAVICTIKLVG